MDTEAVGNVAQIVGPTAAAVAAGASLWSVLVNRRLARESVLPHMSIQPIADTGTGMAGAVIYNGGTGPARGAMFAMVYDGQGTCGYIGHGIVRPGEVVQVRSAIPLREDVESSMIVCCRDPFGNLHTWTAREDHTEVKKSDLQRGFNPRNLEERIRDAYPDLPADEIRWVGNTIGRIE